MKLLSRFFTAVLVIAAFYACSNPVTPGEPDAFEPYTVGSFKIVSPTEAEYIGLQGNQKVMAKSDSAVIDSLGDFQLTLEKDTTVNDAAFIVSFIDSTFNSQPDSIEHLNTDAHIEIKNNNEDIYYTYYGMSSGVATDHTYMNAKFYFSGCNEASLPESNIIVQYREKDNHSNVYKTYFIKTQEMGRATKEIACD